MKPPCAKCHQIHSPDWVRADDRFNAYGAEGYRARTPDAPLRATRAEAMADACAAMAGVVA